MLAAMAHALENATTPARGSHPLALEGARLVREARELAARLLGVTSAERLAFTLNATDSLHLAFCGSLRRGDRVVTTEVEHNSVRRPLQRLRRELDLDVIVVPARGDGTVVAEEILGAVDERTRLVVMAHASNVTGALLPVEAVGRALREREDAVLLVDAAQTLGFRSLREVCELAHVVVASAHKGPGGPLGVGILWTTEGFSLEPVRVGGTGSHSDDLEQPRDEAGGLEAGSPNLPGIAGFAEAARQRLDEIGLEHVREQRAACSRRFLAGVAEINDVHCLGSLTAEREPVFPLTFGRYAPEEAALILESEFGIVARAGLHCASGCHRALGTLPAGALRLSFGALPSEEEVDFVLDSLRMLGSV